MKFDAYSIIRSFQDQYKPRVFVSSSHHANIFNQLTHPAYTHGLSQLFEVVPSIGSADIVLMTDPFIGQHKFGKIPDHVKMFSMSEEPIWDTYAATSSEQLYDPIIEYQGKKIRVINHFTSNLFDFEHVPHYLTISNIILDHYQQQLDKWNTNSDRQNVEQWRSRQVTIAGMLAKRNTAYDIKTNNTHEESNIIPRVRLAEKIKNTDVFNTLIQGTGWKKQGVDEASTRMMHSDPYYQWHVDKLTQCSSQTQYLLAVENTCNIDYLSEKVFDAVISMCVPIFYSPPGQLREHNIKGINLYGHDLNNTDEVFDYVCQQIQQNKQAHEQYIIDNLHVVQNFLRSIEIKTARECHRRIIRLYNMLINNDFTDSNDKLKLTVCRVDEKKGKPAKQYVSSKNIPIPTHVPGEVTLRTVIGCKYSKQNIKPFINYYRTRGVDDIRVVLNHKIDESSDYDDCVDILRELDVPVADTWVGPYDEHVRLSYLESMITDLHEFAWVLTVDCDELQEYPTDNINHFAKELSDKNIWYVNGVLVDRLAADGVLPDKLSPEQSMMEQFPVQANMERTYSKLPGNKAHVNIGDEWLIHKIALHRAIQITGSGSHFFIKPGYKKMGAELPGVIRIGHYKWYGQVSANIKQSMIDHPSITQSKQAYLDFMNDSDQFDLSRLCLDDRYLTGEYINSFIL